MANTGDTFTLSPKERLTITGNAANSGGELLAMEAEYAPGGTAPPEHFHPTQEETFIGLSGTVTARIGGVDRTIGPGEIVTIPAGTKHAFWGDLALQARVPAQQRAPTDAAGRDRPIARLVAH